MAVVLIAGTPAQSTGSVSSISFSLPAGLAAGDYTLVSVALNASSGSITAPSGWTEILSSTSGTASTSLAHAVFYRKWQSGDPSSVSVSHSSGRVGVLPVRVTGADPATFVQAAPGITQAGSGATAINAPTVTPAAGNLAVHTWAARSPTNGTVITWAPGSGVSEVGQASGQAGSQTNAATMVGTSTTGSASGVKTATASASTTGAMGVSFAIVAAAGTTTTTTTAATTTTTTTTGGGSTSYVGMVDEFDDAGNTLWDAAIAYNSSFVAGALHIPCGPTYPTVWPLPSVNLVGQTVTIRLVSTPNTAASSTNAYFQLGNRADLSQYLGWMWTPNNVLVAEHKTASVVSKGTATYTAGLWLRIGESGGTVRWWTSTNGTSWTERGSMSTATVGFDLSNLELKMGSGHWQAEASPGTAVWDSLAVTGNLYPVQTPAHRLRSGFFVPQDGSAESINDIQNMIGTTVSHVLWFADVPNAVPTSNLQAIVSAGRIPVVGLEPWDSAVGGPNQTSWQLADIIAGTHDGHYTRWANALRDLGSEVWLRFAHEMNGTWYPWAAGVNGNTAAEYITAWRRVHGIFQAAGATNVKWMWAPNTIFGGAPAYSTIYPGDAYVDLLGVDGYNWVEGTDPARWRESPAALYSESLKQLRALSPGKKIWIAECSSSEYSASLGTYKADWITKFFTYLASQPDLDGYLWFHIQKEKDWRINSTAAAQTAFTNAVTANKALLFLGEAATTTTTTTAATTTTTTTTPGRWQPVQGSTWHIQYTGTIDLELDRDVYNLDVEDTPKATVDYLHSRGKKVIGYFSAGTVENWRDDYASFPPEVIGTAMGEWEGEWWLDVSNLAALMPIMTARIQLAKDKGFDAVDPDNTDAWTHTTAEIGFDITVGEQRAYQQALADAAHARGLACGLKNNGNDIDNMPFIDFAVNEQAYQYNEMSDYAAFLAAGKVVFNIEYVLTSAQIDPLYVPGVSTLIGPLDLDGPTTVYVPTGGTTTTTTTTAPPPANLYNDPGFTNPTLNAARSVGAWTFGGGQAVRSGATTTEDFYLNDTNAWGGSSGMTPGQEYTITITVTPASGTVWVDPYRAEPWTSLSLGRSVTGTTDVSFTMTWAGPHTFVGYWIDGPVTITNPRIVPAGAAPESHSGTGTLSGDGSLTGLPGAIAHTGTGALAGGGTLATTGSLALAGTGTVSGEGTLAGTGGPVQTGSGALSAAGTLTGSGVPAFSGTATMTGDGAVGGSGTATQPPHVVGEQELVTNGRGEAGNNTNFSLFTFDASDAPEGTAGSFYTVTQNSTSVSDELIPIDPARTYTLRMEMRQRTPGNQGRAYYGLMPVDAYGNQVSPANYMRQAGTTTTLAEPINNGDTTIKLTDSANWSGLPSKPAGASPHLRRIILWNYIDPGGYAWPVETYSRNLSINDAWADDAIDPVTHTITLRAPWANGSVPAGTPLSNASSGGSYIYGAPSNVLLTEEWADFQATMAPGPLNDKALPATFASGWPEGTAAVKILWLLNRGAPGSAHAVAGVSLTAVPHFIGAGSLSGTGVVGYKGTGTVSGDGTLSAVGAAQLPGFGTGVFSGAGTFTGTTGPLTLTGPAPLTADGALSGQVSALTLAPFTAPPLSGGGTLAGSGVAGFAGAGALAGGGALTGSGVAKIHATASAALSGTGSLTGTGLAVIPPPVIEGYVLPGGPEGGSTLAAFDLGGVFRGQVPAPLSTEWVTRENELATLRVLYPESAPRWALLQGACELAYWIERPNRTFLEPRNARFVCVRDGWERLKDNTRVHAYEFVSIAAELSKHKLQEGSGTERTFSGVTGGAIIIEFVDEIKAGGGLPWLQLGFTATTDSRGEPWPYYLENGQVQGTQVQNEVIPLRTKDLLTVIRGMARVVSWTEGRTLMMAPWKPGEASPMRLPDRLLTESPEQINHDAMYSHIQVLGDEGAHWMFEVPGANPAYGKRVLTVQEQGVTSLAQAAFRAEELYPQVRDAAQMYVRQWRITPGTPWLPGVDCELGQWITGDTKDGRNQPLRIAAMSIQDAIQGRTGFVTVGTVDDGLVLQLAKRDRDRSGGVGVILGTPKPVPPPVAERQWPQAPQGVSGSLSGWPLPGGGYGGVIGATWQAVTTDTVGNVMEVDGYTVRAHKQGDPAWTDPLFRTKGDLLGNIEIAGGLVPGDVWELQVAAMEGDDTGTWSQVWSGTVVADSQAPGVPSKLTGHSEPAQVVLEWDGLDANASPMSLDLKELEIKADGVAKVWTMGLQNRQLRIDAGPGKDLNVDQTYTFRARAVDYVPNFSGWSEPTTIGVRPVIVWPATPGGLIVQVETVAVPGGTYQSVLTASWTAVTVDEQGQPVTIEAYPVRVRRTAGEYPIDWFDLGETAGLTYSGSSALMAVGDTWEVIVGARSSDGHTGMFSPAQVIVVPPDTVAPPTPAAPTVTSANGGVTVRTTGLTAGGGAMPDDLDHFRIMQTGVAQPVGQIDPITLRQTLFGLTVGLSYEFRLIAVDKAGNPSPASAPSSASVVSVLTDTEWGQRMAKATTWGDQLYPDPGWTEPERTALRAAAGPFTITNGAAVATSTAARQLWLTPDGGFTNALVTYEAGAEYIVRLNAQAGAATGWVRLVQRDQTNGAFTYVSPQVDLAIGGQAVPEWTWTAPAAGTRYQLGVWTSGGPITLWNISVRRRTIATELGTDSVTARAFFGDQAMVSKMTAAIANFDTVNAGWVKSAMITADAIDGKLFTGSKFIGSIFTTNNTPNRGLWINGLDNTFKSFNLTSGVEELRVASGDLQVTGSFSTRGAFPWMDISRNLWGDMTGVQFTHGPDWQTKAEFLTNASKWGNDLPGSVYLRGGNRTAQTMRPTFVLRSGRPVDGSDNWWPEIEQLLGIGDINYGRRLLSDVGLNKTRIYDFADFIKFETRGGGMMIEMPVPNTVHDISIRSLTGGITLFAGNSWIRPVGIAATTGGEDLALETDYKMSFRSSLSKDKLEKELMGGGRPLLELLEVKGKTWVDRGRREMDPDFSTRYGGVVFEDVAEVSARHGGSLDFLLIHRNNQPLGISYNAMAPAMLGISAHHQTWLEHHDVVLADHLARIVTLENALGIGAE